MRGCFSPLKEAPQGEGISPVRGYFRPAKKEIAFLAKTGFYISIDARATCFGLDNRWFVTTYGHLLFFSIKSLF